VEERDWTSAYAKTYRRVEERDWTSAYTKTYKRVEEKTGGVLK
jgi:hypothetical protein